MNDQPNTTDDVEGHGRNFPFADDSDPSGPDLKGTRLPSTEESDDTEGHAPRIGMGADSESAEGDTDTEAHGRGTP